MTINSFSSECNSRAISVFPSCLTPQTYGTTLFWAEEYWAVMEIQELKKKYPCIDFSGLIDPYFIQRFPNFIKGSTHEIVIGTKKFNDISTVLWEDNRRLLNIATSHAPSRFIAESYWDKYNDDFGIITFDAHLDLATYQKLHGAWITKELASITTVIGGWADTSHDFEEASCLFPFIESNLKDIITNRDLKAWLSGKKIYLSIDLDYCQLSQRDYLGYSNFWHRNKIIGHSMTIKQMLTGYNEDNQSNTPPLLGKSLNLFSNIETFTRKKKESLQRQTNEIIYILEKISQLCRKNSATLLSIDFVEYSPICDWHQLTIKEFMENYPRYRTFIDF